MFTRILEDLNSRFTEKSPLSELDTVFLFFTLRASLLMYVGKLF